MFFHQRLSRRLAEENLIQEVREAAGEDLSHTAALELVKEVYTTSTAKGQEWTNDVAFLAWMNNPQSLEEHKQKLRAECVAKQMVAMASSSGNMKALPQGLSALLRTVSLSETKSWSFFMFAVANMRSDLQEKNSMIFDSSLEANYV